MTRRIPSLLAVLLLVAGRAIGVLGDIPPLNIISLGDSYASGNGARAPDGSRNFEGPTKCFRSPTNWGAQFADYYRDSYNVTYINNACSATMLVHWTSPRALGKRPGKCPSIGVGAPDQPYYEQTSHFVCSRFMPPQLDVIDNTTDLVVFTIGIVEAVRNWRIITTCIIGLRVAVPGPARRCQQVLNVGYRGIPKMLINLEAGLLKLWDKMGQRGKAVQFLYPMVVVDTPRILHDLDGFSLDTSTAVRTYLTKIDNEIVGVIQKVNQAIGTDFVQIFNTSALFAGHEADSYPWRPARPESWFIEDIYLDKYREEMYHPNPTGHFNIAAAAALAGYIT